MFPLCTVSWYLQTTGASPVILVRLDHQQITALAAWWHDGAPARILLCKIMVRPARPRSYLRRWRPWRQCILWVTAGMYASMFVYNMYSIHVSVWTRVLFYISVVKNNFLAKKKKIRGQNLKIHPRMSIGLNDLKNGYTKYFKNCISHDGLGPLSKILAVNWWSFYCTTYNKITILRGFSVNTAAVLSYI